MPKAKKTKATGLAPLSANGAASSCATRVAARGAAPRAEPKARYCKTCEKPMKGHPKGQCGANTHSALDARVVLRLSSLSQIDAVVADVLEASEGVVNTEAILAAMAVKGLEFPEGKTLANYIPDLNCSDSDVEDNDEVTVTVSLPPPVGKETQPPIDEAPGDVSAAVLLEPGVQPDVMQVDGDLGSAAGGDGTASNGMPMLVLVQVKTKKKRVKYELRNEWRSTRGGNVPLNLEGNGLHRAEYPTQAEKAKRTPRMFQAMAQRGDTLASRTGGYALCVFVPRGGGGIMRSWHSDRVEQDVPQLVPEIRRHVFEDLQPFRQQYMASIEAENKAMQAKLDYYQSLADEHSKENVKLREEIEELKQLRQRT
ncbi:hypothetical protein AURDEDRAFT_163578 [Auricularia subglabra TFB-10046 SS5]|nr:hypothetical protein AURDEDRAFT_163578 [Auricularia subglabra TFB-10046 SS5]